MGVLESIGPIDIPYFKMGNVDSTDLFCANEMAIFEFYLANRARYRRVLDCGANIGVHSIIMARCGWEVRAFEPDLIHLEQLRHNLRINRVDVEVHASAISLEDGYADFTRVLDNTTSSHLDGAKTPHGPTEIFKVRTEAAAPHLAWADLAKIDIEGHEAAVITGVPFDIWATTDTIVEVGSERNAALILFFFNNSLINLFSQKIKWRKVEKLEDMPISHRDGSLFITPKPTMPWGDK